MKKLITSIAALLLIVSVTRAADTLESQTSNVLKSVSNHASLEATPAYASSAAYVQMMEENLALKLQLEQMTDRADNLNNMLSYSNMMHTTIANLNGEIAAEKDAENNSKLDYAKMMTTTLVNLNTIVLTSL